MGQKIKMQHQKKVLNIKGSILLKKEYSQAVKKMMYALHGLLKLTKLLMIKVKSKLIMITQ